MDVTLIVGIVGVAGVVIGNVISYLLRRWEMGALWAKEERRQTSDRKRKDYETDLRVVNDSLDMLMEMFGKMEWSRAWGKDRGESRAEWVREVYLLVWRAVMVTRSLENQELENDYQELVEALAGWVNALHYASGKAKKGEEENLEELHNEMIAMAPKIRRRIRELLREA